MLRCQVRHQNGARTEERTRDVVDFSAFQQVILCGKLFVLHFGPYGASLVRSIRTRRHGKRWCTGRGLQRIGETRGVPTSRARGLPGGCLHDASAARSQEARDVVVVRPDWAAWRPVQAPVSSDGPGDAGAPHGKSTPRANVDRDGRDFWGALKLMGVVSGPVVRGMPSALRERGLGWERRLGRSEADQVVAGPGGSRMPTALFALRGGDVPMANAPRCRDRVRIAVPVRLRPRARKVMWRVRYFARSSAWQATCYRARISQLCSPAPTLRRS